MSQSSTTPVLDGPSRLGHATEVTESKERRREREHQARARETRMTRLLGSVGGPASGRAGTDSQAGPV